MTDDDLRALFDMATSYIHISDYPEDDEVDTLRRIATQLGVEPEKVTPYGHAHRYPHLAKPDGWVRVRDELRPRNCTHCFKPSDGPPHTGVELDRRLPEKSHADGRKPGGLVLPPQPYLYDPAVDGPLIPIRPDPWLSHPDPGLRSSWWETMPGIATIVILLVAVMTATYLLIGG